MPGNTDSLPTGSKRRFPSRRSRLTSPVSVCRRLRFEALENRALLSASSPSIDEGSYAVVPMPHDDGILGYPVGTSALFQSNLVGLSDFADYYVVNGERMPLLRTDGSIIVRFDGSLHKNEVRQLVDEWLAEGGLLDGYKLKYVLTDRSHVFTSSQDTSAALAALADADGVDWAGPTFFKPRPGSSSPYEGRDYYIADQLMITLKPGVDAEAYFDGRFGGWGRTFAARNDSHFLVYLDGGPLTTLEIVSQLAADPDVASAVPRGIGNIQFLPWPLPWPYDPFPRYLPVVRIPDSLPIPRAPVSGVPEGAESIGSDPGAGSAPESPPEETETPQSIAPEDEVAEGGTAASPDEGSAPHEEPVAEVETSAVSLVAVDMQGNPITNIDVGQQFQIQVYVQDTSEKSHGVFAAYVNLHFDAGMAELSGPVTFPSTHLLDDINETEPGVLNAGAILSFAPNGSGPLLLYTATFTAKSGGQLSMSTAASALLGHDILHFGGDAPVLPENVNFGTLDVTIVGPSSGGDPGGASESSESNNQVGSGTPAPPSSSEETEAAPPIVPEDDIIEEGETSSPAPGSAAGFEMDADVETGAVSLAAVDMQGNPISSVEVGQQFQVQVSVQDTSADPHGVFSSFVRMSFDAQMADLTGPVAFPSTFVLKKGITSEPGVVTAGAILDTEPTGPDQLLLFTATFTATSAGTFSLTTAPSARTSHEILHFLNNDPVDPANIDFGTLDLTIVAPSDVGNSDNDGSREEVAEVNMAPAIAPNDEEPSQSFSPEGDFAADVEPAAEVEAAADAQPAGGDAGIASALAASSASSEEIATLPVSIAARVEAAVAGKIDPAGSSLLLEAPGPDVVDGPFAADLDDELLDVLVAGVGEIGI